jgi:MoxR-like ATPase
VECDQVRLELHELIEAVPDPTAPSIAKFNEVNRLLENWLDLPSRKVRTVWVSKPGNFDVRMRQPGMLRDQPSLALAIFPVMGDIDRCFDQAARVVGPGGNVENVAMCARDDGDQWTIFDVVGPNGPIADSVVRCFGATHHSTGAGVAEVRRSPAGSIATLPLIIDQRVRRMVRLAVASAPAVMLVGPPGTGKSTLVQQLIDEVSAAPGAFGFTEAPTARWVTPEESWTTRDLIGGETVDEKARLRFRPGRVLDAIRANEWLILDEANRADMDRIFGGLLTWLAGHDVTLGRASSEVDAAPIVLAWGHKAQSETDGADRLGEDDVGSSPIVFRAGREWRLLGTYNALDAQRVFRFGQALGRRFVRVPIPAVHSDRFAEILAPEVRGLPQGVATRIVGLYTAHLTAGVPLGPAIFLWLPSYVRAGLTLRFEALDDEDGGDHDENMSPSIVTQDGQLDSLTAEAYVSAAGVWLRTLEDDQLNTLGFEVREVLTDAEWDWVLSMLPILG